MGMQQFEQNVAWQGSTESIKAFVIYKEMVKLLRLSVHKDEFIMVGKDVKITFLGGVKNQAHIMIDAPKEINIARGQAIEKRAAEKDKFIY